MFSRKNLAFATIALAALTAMASSAYARGYDEIHIQNNTSEHLWVAVHYMPPGANGFVSEGWWELCPGESAYIVDSVNSNVYFYAYSAESDLEWSGSDYFYVDGELTPFFLTNTGSEWVNFTYHFNY